MVLEILITGLVAFVKDKCTLKEAEKMQIVLVAGETKHKAELKIYFDSLSKEKPSAKPDDKKTVLGNKVVWIWYLDNELIKFDKTPKIQIFEGHRKKNGDDYVEPIPIPGTDPSDDFSWAPEIHRACGIPIGKAYPRDEVKIDEKFSYTDKFGTVVPFAVARFAALGIAKTGTNPSPNKKNQLSAVISELTDGGEPKVFKFATANYRQAVADKARLTMELKPSASGWVEIRLVNPNTGNERVVYLKNEDTSVDVVNEPTVTPTETHPATLEHFHEYVKLLKDSEDITCLVPVEDVALTEPGQSKKQGMVKSGYPVKCTMCVDCGP